MLISSTKNRVQRGKGDQTHTGTKIDFCSYFILGYFLSTFRSILGSLLVHFGPILGPFKVHLGVC